MRVNSEQKRRDWSIIIFILPLGLVMMMCVGQLAVRMSPNWSVSGEMSSSLDPENAPKQNALIVPPISSDILTPMSWWDTFLTPGSGEVEFPPFVTFEPTLTPSVTATPSETTSPTVSPTGSLTTTPTPPTLTPTKTGTPKPPNICTDTNATNYGGPLPCVYPPTTCTDPLATNNGGPLPCVYPPTTCTDPLATNNGGPLPCVYPPTTCTDPLATNNGGPLPCVYPPTTCTDPLANNNGGPLPCIYPSPTALVGTEVTPPPQIGVGTPEGGIGTINDGDYIVITLSATPIVVNGPSDINYDFVYYEQGQSCGMPACPSGTGIQMDSVIISISMDDVVYYVVFNWGDGTPDNNSNVGDVTTNTGTENDNQNIDSSEVHGTAPEDTGVLVDVDNAPSNPPPGDYWYVAIQAPVAPPADGNDGIGMDSIEIAENTPTP
jgi:hypothetical protein